MDGDNAVGDPTQNQNNCILMDSKGESKGLSVFQLSFIICQLKVHYHQCKVRSDPYQQVWRYKQQIL